MITCKFCKKEILEKEPYFELVDRLFSHVECYTQYNNELLLKIQQHAIAIVRLTQDNNSGANRRARWILKELEK